MAWERLGQLASNVTIVTTTVRTAVNISASGNLSVGFYWSDGSQHSSAAFSGLPSRSNVSQYSDKYRYRVKVERTTGAHLGYVEFNPFIGTDREAGSANFSVSTNVNVFLEAEIINTAPTTPGSFTQPIGVLKGGANITVTWGASTDAEGNLITYYPEYRYYQNGVAQSWVSIANNNSLTRALTLTTDKTIDKIEFRVRAFDGTSYSSYRDSLVFTIGHNTIPTLTLNTANNLTLSEAVGQNEILVDGSALDTESNNTVTIKAQFNNGTIRNLNSAISNGSMPIPFSKLFTYSDKKIFDGDTPLTVELAEHVDHTLKVWAEDGQGGISTVAERKFRVIHNRPPVISDNDRDLGTLMESPSIPYQVNDLEGQAITVTEKINGQVIRTFEATPNTDYTLEIPIEMWIPLQLQQHSLTIEAVDTIGAKSIRTFTFTRNEDTILLELKNPFVTDIAASRILVTPDVYVPIGSTIKIEACNNAFDSEPTWEDITGMAMNKRGYTFTNTEKTAEEWGINIRFTLEKGTASQQVRLEGFGGAFD
ncbi:hypothetical protein SLU01_19520 [Sporosarcina luteola]|uniref:Fibronectin type-III domain-containing protein n=1 Tax=Sporosarcina luteola TaxID=582850 RepID=A0A511Z875_9BACL|nr:hypothetical protein [Sporosarcina luteola]GEN83640.1 hypothetical protein SLU01_19520 [Sporosarcina luteola]